MKNKALPMKTHINAEMFMGNIQYPSTHTDQKQEL